MRRRVRRQALGILALTATLLLAMPASALAADSRAAEGSGGWTFAWERLADLWDGIREAAAGLIPSWERDDVPVPTKPPPLPTPPAPLPDPTPQDDGDEGSGTDPNG